MKKEDLVPNRVGKVKCAGYQLAARTKKIGALVDKCCSSQCEETGSFSSRDKD